MDKDDLSAWTEEGRRLGYDLYLYSRWVPRVDWPASVAEGYRLAFARQLSRRPGDRFERKWLQLRLSALARELRVDDSVTPALLREIDVSHCPVTRQLLTHGLRQPTDWSVDRLDNDGTYVVPNLAVMSQRANAAKTDLGFAEVRKLAELTEPMHGLAPMEWKRMSSLMLGPCFMHRPQEAPILPLLAPIPPRTARPGMQLVQQVLINGCHRPADKNALARLFRPSMPDERARRGLSLLLDTVHNSLKHCEQACDAWLDDRAMAALSAWRACLPDAHWALVCAVAATLTGARRAYQPPAHEWPARPPPVAPPFKRS